MIKSTLVTAISERLVHSKASLTAADVKRATQLILEAMKQAALKKQRIEIRGFGAFQLHYKQARTNRNPKTGDSVQTPAKYVLHFKVGRDLRLRVDEH